MLSLSRGVLVIPITYLVLIDGPLRWLFGLIALAVITDWFDGRLARWSHTVSDWGKVLDPLADKLMAVSVTLALVIRGSLPAWFIGLVGTRDVLIVLGGVLLARRTGHVFMSLWSGKVAVTALAVTVVAALFHADPPVLEVCIWVTTGLLLYSFGRYLVRALRVLRDGVDPVAAGLDGEAGRTIAQVHQPPEGAAPSTGSADISTVPDASVSDASVRS